MNDINDRQHYVFLEEGDTLISGDLYQIDKRLETAIFSCGTKVMPNTIALRPVSSQSQPQAQTDERKDGLTVWDEYAKIAFAEFCKNDDLDEETVIRWTKNIADAMMKARPK